MGVYIDMEMPPDGRYTVCITHDSHGVVHWVLQNQDTFEFLKHGPVIEAPEPHGRLGDLDALAKQVEHERFHHAHTDGLAARHHVAEYGHFLEAISAAPTIIPASKGE